MRRKIKFSRLTHNRQIVNPRYSQRQMQSPFPAQDLVREIVPFTFDGFPQLFLPFTVETPHGRQMARVMPFFDKVR